jgi:hypothetical protein
VKCKAERKADNPTCTQAVHWKARQTGRAVEGKTDRKVLRQAAKQDIGGQGRVASSETGLRRARDTLKQEGRQPTGHWKAQQKYRQACREMLGMAANRQAVRQGSGRQGIQA